MKKKSHLIKIIITTTLFLFSIILLSLIIKKNVDIFLLFILSLGIGWISGFKLLGWIFLIIPATSITMLTLGVVIKNNFGVFIFLIGLILLFYGAFIGLSAAY